MKLRSFPLVFILLAVSYFAANCGKRSGTTDTDNDGWTDEYEKKIGTNPYGKDPDSDHDGIPDELERRLGLNEHANDSDGDGTADKDEDPDNDGLPTWFELKIESDPGNNSTDDDLPDGFGDQDEDQLIDYLEFSMGTDPFKKDTDGDGLDDYEESNDPNLDGAKADSDGDGIKDGKDPFYTPEGCTDRKTDVTHAFSSCINGKYHMITVRYYVRSCRDRESAVLYEVIKDVETDQPCDEPPSKPTLPDPGDL